MKGRRLTLLLFIALIVSVFSINVSVVGGGFLWDDYTLITSNPKITTLKNVPDFFTKGFWENTPKSRKGGYYRPLILLSYAIDFQLYKLKPWGYHLTNLIVHLLVVIMVFLLFLSLELDSLFSFASALLFGISPFVKEPVGWISGRTDLFAALFVLISLYFFNKYLENKKASYLLFFYLSFIFAMWSKESTYMFPILALALIIYKRKLKEGLLPWLGLNGIWAALMSISLMISLHPGIIYPPRAYRFIKYSLKTVGYYMYRILFPYNVPPVPDYPSIFSNRVFFLVGLAVLLSLFTFAYKPTRRFGFYINSAFIALIPAFGPILLYSPTPIANRFAYLSAIFVYPLIYLVLSTVIKRRWTTIAIVLLAIPIGKNSISMNSLYISENYFWSRTYELSPNSVVVGIDYGLNLISTGKYKKGLKILEELERTRNIPVISYILMEQGKAQAYLNMGNEGKAEEILKTLIKKYPFSVSEEAFDTLFYNYVFYGKIKKAKELVAELLKENEGSPKLLVSMAKLEALEGNYVRAEEFLAKARKNKASQSSIKAIEKLISRMKYLGKLAEKGNRYAEASLYYVKGDFKSSEKILTELIQENPDNPLNYLFMFRLKLKQKQKKKALVALDYLINNVEDYRILEEAFKSAWYEFSNARLSAYIMEKSLKRFPKQPKRKEKIMILNYIKEKLKGG